MYRTSLLCLSLALSACGGPPVTDPQDMGHDLSAPSADLTMADMTIAQLGTRIVNAKGVELSAITDDDNVVFFDSNGGVNVVPVAGGAPTTVGAMAARLVSGKVVLAYENFNNGTAIGDPAAYTKAHGVVPLTTNSVAFAVASDDGEFLVFTNNAAPDGSAADIVLSKTDGTGLVTLFPKSVMVDPCKPVFRFANGNFFVSHCDVPVAIPDAGPPPAATATLSKVTTAGVTTTVKTNLTSTFDVSKAGDKLVVFNVNGDASVVGPDGTTLSTTPVANASSGFFSKDGTVFVGTVDSKLLRWANLAINPVTLVTAKFDTLLATSPDEKFFLYGMTFNDTDFSSDVYQTSTTTPGTESTIVGTVSGAVYGDGFTTDSSRIAYYTNVATGVGTFLSQPVGGGAPTEHGKKVWTSYASTGAKMVFNPNWVAGKANGRADIMVVDTATNAAPTLISAKAEADFFLSHDKTKVIFAYLAAAGKEGLYVATVP